jgi:hypothetical protein
MKVISAFLLMVMICGALSGCAFMKVIMPEDDYNALTNSKTDDPCAGLMDGILERQKLLMIRLQDNPTVDQIAEIERENIELQQELIQAQGACE